MFWKSCIPSSLKRNRDIYCLIIFKAWKQMVELYFFWEPCSLKIGRIIYCSFEGVNWYINKKKREWWEWKNEFSLNAKNEKGGARKTLLDFSIKLLQVFRLLCLKKVEALELQDTNVGKAQKSNERTGRYYNRMAWGSFQFASIDFYISCEIISLISIMPLLIILGLPERNHLWNVEDRSGSSMCLVKRSAH